MRPYFAIIKDSFRAALATRVLYVLLALITGLLLTLAPLHTREILDWKIDILQHVRNPELMVRRLVKEKDDSKKPEVTRLWKMLPNDLRDDLEEIASETDRKQQSKNLGKDPRLAVYARLIEQLNEIIQGRDYYHSEDWERKRIDLEARELIKSGPATLSDEHARRLNRLLVADALSPYLRSGAATSLDVYYASYKWDILSSNQTRQQFAAFAASYIPALFDKFVLSIGLLIAILVTANIIPETFEPGSLNLLLSKPVSRWGLFLSKFIGGCAFVALCSVYLFLGLWVWLGFGLGVWDRAFLLSIPLYILVFAIYYSVSALVGLRYRSAIMAVVITGLFWAMCFGVGSSYGFLKARMDNKQFAEICPVNDSVVCVDGIGTLWDWQDSESQWQEAASVQLGEQEEVAMKMSLYLAKLLIQPYRLPPIVDQESGTVIAGMAAPAPIDPFAQNHQELHIASTADLKFQTQGKFPRDSMRMFAAPSGPVIVDGSGNFYRLKSDRLKRFGSKASDQANAAALLSGGSNSNDDLDFELIGPDDRVSVNETTQVSLNPTTQEIAIYKRGEVSIFSLQEDGKYTSDRSGKVDLQTGPSMSCFLQFAGKTVLLVLGNGQVISIDAQTLTETGRWLPESHFGIEQVRAAQDGSWFGMVYQNRKLWLLNTKTDSPPTSPSTSQVQSPRSPELANVRGQGGVSAISFDDANQLWVADRIDRLTCYELGTMEKKETFSPTGGMFDLLYRYVAKPLYLVCPKPSEFYKVVTHLSDSTNTKHNRDVDLTVAKAGDNPWVPLWSGLGFMAAMLTLSCVLFQFKDY